MKSYCVFCKTGSEVSVAQRINTLDNNIKAVAPVKLMHEKRKGKWCKRKKVLLPGYVFLYSEDIIESKTIRKVPDFYKVLKYDSNIRELLGKDREYSMWLLRHHGSIKSSKVLAEGKNVKVIEGPLLDASGTIVKLDKHKRKAWVEFEFDGQVRTLVLPAECISAK